MNAQLDLALKARDEGIARVKAKNSDFVETMKSVARMIARRKGTVCADDLRQWAADNGMAPTSSNAWGAIFCRNPDFVLHGYARSYQVQGHGNLQRLWKLKTAIKGRYILLAVSVTANLILAAALGMAHTSSNRIRIDADYMLAQRVAVLEVETYIKKRLPRQNAAEIRGVSELIVDAATEFRLSPLLVVRVAITESALNHKAVGDSGRSMGAMQVQRFWVGHIPFVNHERDLLRMDVGIRAGAWVLRHYADICGESEEAMLSCFNGGPRPNEQAKAYARRVAGT